MLKTLQNLHYTFMRKIQFKLLLQKTEKNNPERSLSFISFLTKTLTIRIIILKVAAMHIQFCCTRAFLFSLDKG